MSDTSTVLPVDALHPAFKAALPNSHLVVQASTGSGKSTRLPLWAMSMGRVLVIQPRRIACVALAQFLAAQRQQQVGEDIGYAIRFEQKHTMQTQVVFATPGVALRWASEGALDAFACVVLDEFHERRWDTDLLLALLLKRNSHRLVLTSATVNGPALAQYAGAKLLEGDGNLYPVDVAYHSQRDEQMPDARHLAERVKSVVHTALNDCVGDILVFLPGRGEIEQCRRQLAQCGATVLPLFANVGEAEQQQVLAGGETRRVILSTNVAETSLTLPKIGVVIDSGLERRTHQRNGRTVLSLHPISQASAEQRRGRAGRLGPGHCFRLWGRGAPLAAHTPPEILREELTELVLAAAAAGSPAATLTFPDSLPPKALSAAQVLLADMRAIDGKGEITDYGRRLFPLPIDTLFAHLISAMCNDSNREAMVDLVAGLSFGGRWYQWPQDEMGLRELEAWQKLPCDALSLVQLLRDPKPPAFCQVDARIHAEARTLSRQLRQALNLGKLSEAKVINRESWLDDVLRASPSLAYVRRLKRPGAMGNGYSELLIGDQCRLTEQAVAAIAFDTFSVPGRGTRQTLNRGTCLAPITFQQMRRCGLGEAQLAEAQWQAEQLLVRVEYTYAGRVIDSAEAEPEGEVARRALANLILRNRLLAPAGEQLLSDTQAWALYLALGEGEGEPIESEAWLLSKLEQLGVESGDDVLLLEATDLKFQGIPDWERESFDERFPRTVSLSGLHMRIEYDIPKKIITAIFDRGSRKADPKRWELPRWAGWRVKYQRASRVIDVR